MALAEYRRKRKFEKTPEPAGATGPRDKGQSFVVQKHDATRLHYDFRLEIGGVLVSWAVPKGPSLNPADKRLAMMTEDHPLEYGGFEGVIPEGNYGAGPVMVWDNGTFEPEGTMPTANQLARCELKFRLHGKKLRGSFVLVKTHRPTDKRGNEWLLIKHRDEFASPDWDIDRVDGSVLTGRNLHDIELGVRTHASEPGKLEGARKAAMPSHVEPALATLSQQPFSGPDWLFELKWDGMRVLAWVRDGEVALYSRNARVVTSQFPELAALPGRVSVKQAILDGEVVVLDSQGKPDFGLMQQRMNVAHPARALLGEVPVTYYAFDILYCDGYDLRQVPLIERKDFLKQVLAPQEPVRYSGHILERGEDLFKLAREQGLEGVIGKRVRSAYAAGRSDSWVKLKTTSEVDAVIGGFTAPRGSREHFGALLVGLYEGAKFRFIGGVGTGFTRKSQDALWKTLEPLVVAKCPFRVPPATREQASWLKPELVARVKFAHWTRDRILRAPVYLGLRPDLNPKDCVFSESSS
jgi:bifunctional non-homologous end joining protein LigD